MKNKHSRKGKSRLRLLMAAATFSRYQWYLNNVRLRSTAPGQQAPCWASGRALTWRCTQSSRGIFRQAYNVTMLTFRLKLDLFKHVSFDGAGGSRCSAR